MIKVFTVEEKASAQQTFTTMNEGDVGAKARNSLRAFTLIELLVVIAIIGILSSVVLASLSGARESARDNAKVQEVEQMQTALELYHEDNGHYPQQPDIYYYAYSDADDPCGVGDAKWCGEGTNSRNSLEQELAPYIDKLPRGESIDSVEYIYKHSHSDSDNNSDIYGLGAKLENPNDLSENDGGYDDNRYEVGELPSYCVNKYGDGEDDPGQWYTWYGKDDCHGDGV